MKLEDIKMLLSQILATTDVMRSMLNEKFTETEFFNQMDIHPIFKEYLKKITIGNYATMQMMLYELLVVPKEVFNDRNFKSYSKRYKNLNKFIYDRVETSLTISSYKNETDAKKIDYVRHLRNSLAHSNCDYINESKMVCFIDKRGKKEKCKITLKNCAIVELINELRMLIYEFLKQYIPVIGVSKFEE